MSDSVPDNIPMLAVEERLIRLETALAHNQHDLEEMHIALLSMNEELKSTREQIARLERRLHLLAEPPEERDPVDERPPHY